MPLNKVVTRSVGARGLEVIKIISENISDRFLLIWACFFLYGAIIFVGILSVFGLVPWLSWGKLEQ